MSRRCLVLFLMAVIAASFSACGKKADPDCPKPCSYPRTYPSG